MPTLTNERAIQLRFGVTRLLARSRCHRCGKGPSDHDGARCSSVGETIEHFNNFLNTGIDDRITTRGPGHQLTLNEAYMLRFGCGEAVIENSNPSCRRCGIQWGNHSDARCSRSGETMEQYEQFMRTGLDDHEYELNIPSAINIKLGADPEFEVYDSAKSFISASDCIRGGTSAKFGHDGSSSTGELRTDPGSPEIVVKSISNILSEGYQEIKNYNVFAGAGKRVPLGGHIHFSGIDADRALIGMLDTFIAQPLRRISNTSLRDNSGYGKL
jgi:hypothetical protein